MVVASPTNVSNKTRHDPFGMLLVGRNWEEGSEYRFGFNGYENTDELLGENIAIDFGARIFDARLGKFLTRDLYYKSTPNISSYIFVDNCPIRYVDFKGDFKMDPYFMETYPALATIIAYYLPLLEDNSSASNAWMDVTGLSYIDFVNMITYGGGPWITPTRPSCAGDDSDEYGEEGCDNYKGGICVNNAGGGFNSGPGEYDKDYPNNIFISRYALQELEEKAHAFIESEGLGESELNYAMFKVVWLIMHEATHWGVETFKDADRYTGTQEHGALWEYHTYGINFSYGNTMEELKVDYDGMKNYYFNTFALLDYSNSLTHGMILDLNRDNWGMFQHTLEYNGVERDPTVIEFPPHNYTYEYGEE